MYVPPTITPTPILQGQGLKHLEHTLYSRKASAPEGSYTKRLFEDPELLR